MHDFFDVWVGSRAVPQGAAKLPTRVAASYPGCDAHGATLKGPFSAVSTMFSIVYRSQLEEICMFVHSEDESLRFVHFSLQKSADEVKICKITPRGAAQLTGSSGVFLTRRETLDLLFAQTNRYELILDKSKSGARI